MPSIRQAVAELLANGAGSNTPAKHSHSDPLEAYTSHRGALSGGKEAGGGESWLAY